MPPIRLTLSAVNTLVRGGRQHFQLTYDREDGTKHGVVFPADTFAWRAAELGIDPNTERGELLDMILHEPFMPPSPPAESNPASQDDARAEHSRRVAGAKRCVEIIAGSGRGPDLLAVLRSHPITDADIDHRRRIIAGLNRHIANSPHDPSAERRNAEIGKAH